MISIKKILTKILVRLNALPAQTRIFTATCSTDAGSNPKVATLDDPVGFSLTAGVRVAVTFEKGNTVATPTLRVDGTSQGTAKTIAIPSTATGHTTGSGTTYNGWGAQETIIFTYTGSYWSHTPSGRLGYLAQAGMVSLSDDMEEVQDTLDVIGTTKSESGSAISLASSTSTAVCSISLSAGTWLVIGDCRFPSNSTGMRRLNITDTSGSGSIDVQYPAGSGDVKVMMTEVVKPTATKTYYLNAWQNSGSSLSISAGYATLYAIRIK